MAGILNEDIGPTNVSTLAVAGITKYAEERMLTPVIGNASYLSGGVKFGIGLVADSFMGDNSIGRGVALGFGVDGVEDLLTATFNQTGLGGEVRGFVGGSDAQRQVM